MVRVFTITEASKLTALSAPTLRYYERIGLVGPVAKGATGQRTYTTKDVEWLIFLSLFRSMGMTIRQMQQFAELKRGGLTSAPERKDFLERYRQSILGQIHEREEIIQLVDWKLALLDAKIASGSQQSAQDTFEYIMEWKHRHNVSKTGDTFDNKQIAQAFAAAGDAVAAGKADWDAQRALTTPDFKVYSHGAPEPLNFEGFQRGASELIAAFPAFHHRFEDQVAAGDKVANRITWTARHEGTFKGIAPTHRSVRMAIFNSMRIQNGKVAELWRLADLAGLMRQIGE